MITRRDALVLVAAILARQRQAQAETQTCPGHPETLLLDFGSGACTIQRIKVVNGVYSATISTHDLMVALGGKVGGDE